MSDFLRPDEQFAQLMAAYRKACPEQDATADFMPQLWQKIERRQSFGSRLKVLTRGFVTAAAALSLLLSALSFTISHAVGASTTPAYVDVLAADRGPEQPFGIDPGGSH